MNLDAVPEHIRRAVDDPGSIPIQIQEAFVDAMILMEDMGVVQRDDESTKALLTMSIRLTFAYYFADR